MLNAASARSWLFAAGVPESGLAKHMLAISANPEQVAKFGLDPKEMLTFWDWVGGRFSLWSAIGLPIQLRIERGQLGGQPACLLLDIANRSRRIMSRNKSSDIARIGGSFKRPACLEHPVFG
jgi:hypothetical protein